MTFEKVWEYSVPGQGRVKFFSRNVSSAQRLPNGNTMVAEGATGRMFEATMDNEIVWEYINPYYRGDINNFYRAYRVPYDWVPQLELPTETAVVPARNEEFSRRARETKLDFCHSRHGWCTVRQRPEKSSCRRRNGQILVFFQCPTMSFGEGLENWRAKHVVIFSPVFHTSFHRSG